MSNMSIDVLVEKLANRKLKKICASLDWEIKRLKRLGDSERSTEDEIVFYRTSRAAVMIVRNAIREEMYK